MTPAPRPRRPPADPQKFRVDVRPSRIDGQGAFAAEAIPARRKIGEIRGEAISVHQPDDDLPGRPLGTCGDCRAWFLIDREAGVMLILPDTTARGD